MIPILVTPSAWIKIRRGRFFFFSPAGIPVPGQARMVDVAQQPLLDDVLVSGLIDRVVVSLVSDFKDSLVAGCSLNHPRAIGRVFWHHLFAQNMLPGIKAPDRYIRVHPEGSGDDDCFEVFFGQHLAPIIVLLWPRPSRADQQVRSGSAPSGIYVAQCIEAYIFLLALS